MPDLDMAAYRRAIEAEPQLEAVSLLTKFICKYRPDDKAFCADCVWGFIVKPAAAPHIGWERGLPPTQATDPGASIVQVIDFRKLNPVEVAQSETEKWMRSTDAWDAYTRVLMYMLDEADTGLGHGFGDLSRDMIYSL